MLNIFRQFLQLWSGSARARAFDEEDADRPFRVLIPVAGGPNAAAAISVLPGLARSEHEVTFLHARPRGSPPARPLLTRALDSVEGLSFVEAKEVFAAEPFEAIVAASASHDLVVLGASRDGALCGPGVLDVVRRAACPTIVVRRAQCPRQASRDGVNAFVIAESSPRGVLGLERALRWAREGSDAQTILLVPAPDERREGDPARRPLDLRRYSSQSVRIARRSLDADEILAEVDAAPRDLVLIACDPTSGSDELALVDEVAARTRCAVVCVFASQTGPRTRHRRMAITLS